jgi:hypothetical protein
LEYSNLATASSNSVNKILTLNGFVTPPERIKSKMHFGSSGHINGKTLSSSSFEPSKPQLPSKCRSNDSINRVFTTNGIITPPPRRFFNQSALSLQNQPKNNYIRPLKNSGFNDNVRTPTYQATEACANKSNESKKEPSCQTKAHNEPKVSTLQQLTHYFYLPIYLS